MAPDAWYADGVNAMAELGLVDGVGDGRFNPEGVLTNEEFLTIMGRIVDGFGIGAVLHIGKPAILIGQAQLFRRLGGGAGVEIAPGHAPTETA